MTQPLPIIFEAIEDGNAALLKRLLTDGENPNHIWNGSSPLLHAARKGRPNEMVEDLIEHGAMVDYMDILTEMTPLTHAAKMGSDKTIVTLVRHGADINHVDRLGDTPLHLAKFNSTRRIVIESGGDINAKNSQGDSPLMQAIRKDNEVAFDFFLEAGADLGAEGGNGMTPLMLAVSMGRSGYMDKLIEHGSDADEIDCFGGTSLFYAARRLDEGACVMIRLLKLGASIDAEDHEGRTAFMTAVDYGNQEAMVILAEAGASIFHRDKNGESAEDVARKSGRKDLESLVRSLSDKAMIDGGIMKKSRVAMKKLF